MILTPLAGRATGKHDAVELGVYARNSSVRICIITARKKNSAVTNASGLTFACELTLVSHRSFFSLFKDKEPIDGVPWCKETANLMQQDDGSWVHVARGKVCLSDHFIFRFECEYTGVKPP